MCYIIYKENNTFIKGNTMARKKSIQVLALEKAQIDLQNLLGPFESITFGGGELYILDESYYEKFMNIHNTISKYATETKRGSVYSIHKMVKFINTPSQMAVKYHLTMAKKSMLITDRSKIIDQLAKEKEISKNKILSNTEKFIEKNLIEEGEAKRLRVEAEIKVKDELDEYKKLNSNLKDFDILITTFKERKVYPQLNWQYVSYDENKELKVQKSNTHVSIDKPSILFFDENFEVDNYRKDMKVARFIKDAYRAFGNVYIKPK